MGKRTIGLIAAMPDEIRPLLRKVGSYRAGRLGDLNRYDFTLGENEIVLVESGMGMHRARAATEALIASVTAELLINFGFGGAVLGETAVGDLVLAQSVLRLRAEGLIEGPAPSTDLEETLRRAAASCSGRLKRGVFITTAGIAQKKEVAKLLPEKLTDPVLEMETAAVLDAGREAGIPVLALRGISDGAEEELLFSLEEFCDRDLQIRTWRVLATVTRKPWIVPQLLRLAGNSRKAGEKMACCLAEALKRWE